MSEKIEQRIINALERVKPHLKNDGGDIEFVSFDEETAVVELRFHGRCKDCPLQIMTLRAGIEKVLIKEIPQIRRIESVK